MSKSMRRLAALALGGAIMATALTPLRAADPVTLRASTIPTLDDGAFEVARAKKYFEAEGVTLETTPVVGGAAGIPALVSGQIQLASSNIVTVILAASQGLDVQIVIPGDGTSSSPPDLAGLMAKPDSPIASGKDLEGKRVAVNARNNIVWLYCREWVARTGGDPTKVTFVEVPFPQMLDALQAGRIDAAMMVEPFISSGLEAKTVKAVGWPYSEVQKNIPVAQFVTTKAYAKDHPEVVSALIKAYDRGVDWVAANKTSPEFFDIVAGYTKVPPARLRTSTIPEYPKKVSVKAVQEVVGLMKKNGLLTTDVDAAALIHPDLRAP